MCFPQDIFQSIKISKIRMIRSRAVLSDKNDIMLFIVTLLLCFNVFYDLNLLTVTKKWEKSIEMNKIMWYNTIHKNLTSGRKYKNGSKLRLG